MSDRDRLTGLFKEALLKWENLRNAYLEEKIDDIDNFDDVIIDYLIENGVMVPPCKVGDTIYQIDGVRIYPSTIHEITYTSSKVIFVTENIVFDEQAINNSIFLTREEAEKALERSKGNA